MISTSNTDRAEPRAADLLIPVIRTAATIGFAIAPCSLGFVIIAVSEQLIRSIMVGDDPEMLVSDLQNQFPSEALEVIEEDHDGLVSTVVGLIEHPGRVLELPLDFDGIRSHVLNAIQQLPAGTFSREDHSYAK
jgi:AraC family transcriptional regulator, regulatory protein of adaptative response / methylated-DNA-[protein]-cysteine methyltransferase